MQRAQPIFAARRSPVDEDRGRRCRRVGPRGGGERLDENRAAVERVLEAAYGAGRGRAWAANSRACILACAELWGYRGGLRLL